MERLETLERLERPETLKTLETIRFADPEMTLSIVKVQLNALSGSDLRAIANVRSPMRTCMRACIHACITKIA